ncbi:hypothetical protein MNBD_GAMMA12-3130 [hydrothermal vent metagenome]|uniref:NfeD-like C-terminal domain-containing protein n=1 Tax=hydrothermal vent metagenome TaxID=652676 RepID=A0A3B0YG05_9ZZZZ
MNYWHWFALAGILLALEMVVPGAFFLWVGIAAAFTAVLLLIFSSMIIEVQVSVFAVLSVASLVIWWKWYRNPIATDQPNLNRRGAQYVGRTFTLTEPVVNNFGKIRVDDSYWKIQGDDCVVGSSVKVVGVDGVVLQVETIKRS